MPGFCRVEGSHRGREAGRGPGLCLYFRGSRDQSSAGGLTRRGIRESHPKERGRQAGVISALPQASCLSSGGAWS